MSATPGSVEAPGCAHCMGTHEVKPGEVCPKCGDLTPAELEKAAKFCDFQSVHEYLCWMLWLNNEGAA